MHGVSQGVSSVAMATVDSLLTGGTYSGSKCCWRQCVTRGEAFSLLGELNYLPIDTENQRYHIL